MISFEFAGRPSGTPSRTGANGGHARADRERHGALAVAAAWISVVAWIAVAASAQEPAAPGESTGAVVTLDDTTSPNREADLGQIELAPTGKIAGCVSDSRTGAPLPGVQVIAHGLTWRGEGRGTTDANGRYSIGGLEPAYYSVQAESVAADPRLVVPVHDPVQVETGKMARADFAVREGVRISGRVVDAVTGEPLPEATVSCRITKVPDQSAISVWRQTWVDAGGRFEVCVPPGICELRTYAGMRRAVDDSSRTIDVGETPPDPRPNAVLPTAVSRQNRG